MIKKWTNIIQSDLGTIRDIQYTIDYFESFGSDFVLRELEDGIGIVGCIAQENWNKVKVCIEMIVYLKPEHRGRLGLKKVVKEIEKIAKELDCDYVSFGADIGYRDSKFLNLLKRLGYKDYCLIIELV